MKSGRFIVLCAPTPRSQAYLQAMAYADLKPEHIIVYGAKEESANLSGTNHCLKDQTVFVADFSQSINKSIQSMACSVRYINSRCIDSDEIYHALIQQQPELTVFSGFGGQIVPERILAAAGKMLHIHSGWLPEYRGSTTLYYSLLNEGQCAASALLLTQEIDGGPVLARQHYPAPHAEDNIDYVYDCSIRADLLIKVLSRYTKENRLPGPINIEGDGEMYYVIHPLLKHLAILSLE